MSSRREHLMNLILEERARQFNLPGSEFDARNTPNDWVAIAMHYLGEEVRRGGAMPDEKAFERGLIKAAAVIMAALENIPSMTEKSHLCPSNQDSARSDAWAK